MAERKVQSKYIPPDYDHRLMKIAERAIKKKPSRRAGANGTGAAAGKEMTIRLMLPFNVHCDKCGTYMYRGTKFNGKKEDCDETYMGTKIVRFRFHCSGCSASVVYKTDPQNAGFKMVSGARENKTSAGMFNPLEGVVEKDDLPEPSDQDAMKALEARALETRNEMQVQRELEELKKQSEARYVVGRGVVTLNAAEDVENDDDAAAIRAFQSKKRNLEMSDHSSTSVWGGLDGSGGAAVSVAAAVSFPSHLKAPVEVKKKLKSFVAYADSDDE